MIFGFFLRMIPFVIQGGTGGLGLPLTIDDFWLFSAHDPVCDTEGDGGGRALPLTVDDFWVFPAHYLVCDTESVGRGGFVLQIVIFTDRNF